MKYLTLLLLLLCSVHTFAQKPASAAPQKIKPDTLLQGLKTELTEEDMPVDTSPVYLKYDPAIKEHYPVTVNITNVMWELPKAFMIDSTMVDPHYFYYLAPNHVGEVHIMKNPKGGLNVTLKNEYKGDLPKILKSKLISITDIKNTYTDKADINKPTIYILNGDMLTDTSGIKIPEVCLLHVSIANASETPYFKTAMPGILIMMISTKYASSKPYHPPMVIR